MDVSRAYGSSYVKLAWRGWRDGDEAFLMMVDGVELNHLYFNSTETPLATLPLSNIKQVEVIYGPASVSYGANAAMGVINVITIKDEATNGSYASTHLAVGTANTRLADVNYFYKLNSLRLSATVRVDDGNLDNSKNNAYEYTKDAYYADRRLWGGFLDNPNLGGRFSSHRRNIGVDLRAYLGETALAAQYYRLDTGYGLEYAADKVQNNGLWARTELSLSALRTDPLTERIAATTRLQFRRSDVANDSYFVDAFFDSTQGKYVAAVSYWQSLNYGWNATEDVAIRSFEPLTFNVGVSYRQRNLNKAYDLNGEASDPLAPGGYVPVDTLDATTYNYPHPPDEAFRSQNRITREDIGGYFQARYRLEHGFTGADTHQVNAGFRVDHDSQYGTFTTARGGYVGHYGGWTAKVLYGEGFQEPVARLLYGGWKGAAAIPTSSRRPPARSKPAPITPSLTSALCSTGTTSGTRIPSSPRPAAPATLESGRWGGFDLHLRDRPVRAEHRRAGLGLLHAIPTNPGAEVRPAGQPHRLWSHRRPGD